MPRLPSPREMIERLVALETLSSTDPELDRSNRPLVDLLAGWAEGLGFRVEVVPVDADGRKVNLVATFGSGEGGLVLAGHTDTVPFDAERWRSDPFVATEREGRLHGLGTADMKSFLGLALTAASVHDAASLREPLILLATADEESTMAGARALARGGPLSARSAIVGEPTSLRPVRSHKGLFMEAIRVIGRSGHSSDPALGA